MYKYFYVNLGAIYAKGLCFIRDEIKPVSALCENWYWYVHKWGRCYCSNSKRTEHFSLLLLLGILPKGCSGMSLGRVELEQDGDSSLRSLKVPRVEKRNNCLEKEISCYHVIFNLSRILYIHIQLCIERLDKKVPLNKYELAATAPNLKEQSAFV